MTLKRNQVKLVARLFLNLQKQSIEFGAVFDVFDKESHGDDIVYSIRTGNAKLDAYKNLKVSGFLSPEMVQDEGSIYFQRYNVRAESRSLSLTDSIALGATSKSILTKLEKAEEEQGSCYYFTDFLNRVLTVLKVDEIWFEAKSDLDGKPRSTAYKLDDIEELTSFARNFAFEKMGWSRHAS